MAEEKTFSVGVQTSSPKRISVTSNVSENPITASADTGLYYSQLAKNWAIGEGLIQNEDYSSKTWAGESKSSADLSKMYSEAASLDLNNLENKIIEYDEQLNTTITEGLDNINASVTSGVETIETLQANSLAEITTNKESALSDIDINKTNTLAQISTLANESIADINAVGKSYDNLTYRNITNCLLEIPQRIKYDLTDGTLTIKAGSVVIVPYGTEDLTATYPVGSTFLNDNFTVYDTQYTEDTEGNGKFFVWAELVNDIIEVSGTSTDSYLRPVVLDLSVSELVIYRDTVSGTSDYTGTGNHILYRTDENIVKKYTSGTLRTSVVSLPLLTVVGNSAIIIGSIKQIFNGMGYIGTTKWIDKDVKMLLSDGFNPDGTYKSIEYTQPELTTYTGGTANTTYNVTYHPNDIINDFNVSVSQKKYTFEVDSLSDASIADTSFGVAYVRNENRFYVHVPNTTDWVPVKGCRIGCHYNSDTNGTVGLFNPNQPFRITDNAVSKSGDTMTGVLYFKFDDNFDYSQTTTTQEAYSGIVDFTDENGNLCGQISNYINTSNNLVTRFDAIRSVNGEIKRSSIYAFVDADGNAKTQAPTPASSDNSTQIATTQFVKSVLSSSGNGLATFNKAANGYIKFANGIIINWGSCTSAQNTAKTATFALSFTSTNYKLCLTQNSNNQVDQYANTIYVSSRTTTNFTYTSPAKASVTWHWIAVGY